MGILRLECRGRKTTHTFSVGFPVTIWEFPKIRVPDFGVLIIRTLLFRVLY